MPVLADVRTVRAPLQPAGHRLFIGRNQLNNLRVPTAPPHDSCPDAKQYIQVRSVRQLVGGRVETYPPTCPDNGGCLACWRRNGMESSPQAVRVRPFQTCTRIRSGGKRCSSAVCVFVSDADGTDEKNHLRSGEALWLAGEMCVRGGQCRSTSVAVAGGPGRAGGGHAHGATIILLLMVALIDPNHSLLMLRVLIRGGGLVVGQLARGRCVVPAHAPTS